MAAEERQEPFYWSSASIYPDGPYPEEAADIETSPQDCLSGENWSVFYEPAEWKTAMADAQRFSWSSTHLRDGSPKLAAGWLRFGVVEAVPVAEPPERPERPVLVLQPRLPQHAAAASTGSPGSSSSEDESDAAVGEEGAARSSEQ
jgi:hypothetical protein